MTDAPDDLQADNSDGEQDDPGWPISFLLLVAAGGLYLVVRFFAIVKDLVT